MSLKAVGAAMAAVPVLALVATVGGGSSLLGLPVSDTSAAGPTGSGAVLASDRRMPEKFRALISKWGNECSALSPQVLAAQLYQESGFRTDRGAVSSANAMGIAQFIPSTWAKYGVDGNGDGKRDIWDPEDAIPSAAKYDCQAAHDTRKVPGDATRNMLAAYNAGSYKVRKYGGIPPYKETQDYVRIITSTAASFEMSANSSSAVAEKVIAYASSKIGTPYVWGGNGGADGGFDCSGLTKAAFEAAGITLPRVANDQYDATPKVSGPQIGDLVFFSQKKRVAGYRFNSRDIDHVGIYLGNGKFLDAPHTGAKVRIEPMWWDLFMGATRPTASKTV
ncbi:NlpC/P60 family protein [Streptomyces sp. MMS24-I2-30]|uniref:C40 family peptidase n=1 Tax=Streptomyces sp. MMS24-I2-30 TaxID=3351564 RepID=UPI003896C777